MSSFLSNPLWGFAPLACVLFGTAILIASQIGWLGSRLADFAELHLRYYGDGRPPTEVSQVGIWRWYSLRNSMIVMTPQGTATGSLTNIFISFDKPVRAGTLEVKSVDYIIPKYEVKEFNNRFAIIAIDETPAGILDISVRNR